MVAARWRPPCPKELTSRRVILPIYFPSTWVANHCSEEAGWVGGHRRTASLHLGFSRRSGLVAAVENVGSRCRVAGKILRSSRPPQNRTCRFLRIRLKHLPAYRVSAVLVSVLDGTSGGRELGHCHRWQDHDGPRHWCCRADQGRHRRPPCRPRTGPPAV